jgi:phenylalanyl-tRNA synthetase beta chain
LKISTLWLKDYVKIRGSEEALADRLTMAGLEVERIEKASKGLVFETEVTSNRPDWLSYLGVAREVAALYGTPSAAPKNKAPKKTTLFPAEFNVEIKDSEKCPYYTATIIKGIKPCATPAHIKERLESVGLRSVNFIVDVTNFVLLESGQPLHAFDLNLLQGSQIIIRKAKEEEKMTAIDGKVLELTHEDLVIADKDRAIALAGVMGGKDTEVSDKTTDILLESAFFQSQTVRRTSHRYTLSTDSSYRFERRVDPEGVLWARDRVISLLLEHTTVEEITKVKTVGRKPAAGKTVQLAYEKMDSLLGAKIPRSDVEKIFKNLGISIIAKSKNQIKVKAPSFRPDLLQAVDLIEEAARIYGFDRLGETLPTLVALPNTITPKTKFEVVNQVTDHLASAGFWEAQTFSIIRGNIYESLFKNKSQLISIYNPQNQDLNLMRPSLIPGLLESAAHNQNHGNKFVKLFEVGQIYLAQGKNLPDERSTLGMISFGKPDKIWANDPKEQSLFDLKGTLEQLLASLGIKNVSWSEGKSPYLSAGTVLDLNVKGKSIGHIGEASDELLEKSSLEGTVIIAEIDLKSILSISTRERQFKAVSKYPAVTRDFSLLVPKDVSVSSVSETILDEGNEWLQDIRLFDVFEGQNIPSGVKSLAFSLEYQASDKTLASEEVQTEHARIAQVIQERYNAKLPEAKS